MEVARGADGIELDLDSLLWRLRECSRSDAVSDRRTPHADTKKWAIFAELHLYGTFYDLGNTTDVISTACIRACCMGANIVLVLTRGAAYRQWQTSNLAILRLRCGR
jgi:hypothetical protein